MQQLLPLQLLLSLQQILLLQLLLLVQLDCSCRARPLTVMLWKLCISTNLHLGYNKIPSILSVKNLVDHAGCILDCRPSVTTT